MQVGENIRALRKEKGITQKELGRLSGIAEITIRQYESGKYQPKIETIEKIAKALDVPIIKIKEDLTWAEHENTDEYKKIERLALLEEGILTILSSIYGAVEDKEVESDKSDWTSHYYLVGRPPNTFILYDGDIEALADSFKASIPFLVDRMKDNRPEEIVKQECIEELNTLASLQK